ncbi:MAG: SBBP repeat-containing protein [Bacteroidota bacterium]
MKRNLLIILLAFTGLSANAQAWQWAKSAGNAQADVSNGVVTDIHGRIYVTGYYTGDTLFIGADSIINTTNHNAFITKYDAAGNVLWSKGSIGNSKAAGTAITTDLNGYIFVTGTFNSATDTAVIFGADTLTNIAGNALSGTNDIFILKYDSSGVLIWARRAGGLGGDLSTGIATDHSGNVYVSGNMSSAYNIGDSLNFGPSTLFYNGVGNMFLLKYTSAGTPVWARTQSGNGAAIANGVATDSVGNIYVTGNYVDSAITFGSTTLPAPALIHFMFLVKFSSAGNVLWANGYGGAKDDNSLCVTADHSCNVYISGYFKASTTFGSISLSNTASNNTTYYMFLTKCDSMGNVLWAKSGALGTYNFGYGVTTDALNNVYLTGTFQNGISFDSANSIPSVKGLYVVKYSSAGTVVWDKGVISSNPSVGYGIAVDETMNVYVTGYNSGSVIFGADTLVFHGLQDILIAKLSNSNVGIEEVNFIKSNIAIYPNPNDGIFYLKTSFSSPEAQLILTDIYGRKIYSTKLANTNSMEAITLPAIGNGMYFWEVVSENKMAGNGKVVIFK